MLHQGRHGDGRAGAVGGEVPGRPGQRGVVVFLAGTWRVLLALCDAFFDYLEERTFPGGCFFAGAVLEMGSRPGPVKEQILAFQGRFTSLMRQFVVAALERHELDATEDPDALTFELNGIILAANASFVLRDDPAVLTLARSVVRRRLGITTTPSPRRRRVTRR